MFVRDFILGTSASAPSANRGLSSLIVKHGDLHFLVDCGEGTTRQIERSEIGFQHLRRVLLTHGHLDHILGLGGLVGVFRHDEPIEELEIFGGKSRSSAPARWSMLWSCAARHRHHILVR